MKKTKDEAIKILEEFLIHKDLKISGDFLDKKPDRATIYNPPINSYWVYVTGISDTKNNIIQSSTLVAIDKETGAVRFYGSGNDEG